MYMGETAGQIFLGSRGEQVYGQHFRASSATFKLLCNDIESVFVLITKNLHPYLFHKLAFFAYPLMWPRISFYCEFICDIEEDLSVFSISSQLFYCNSIHHNLPTN